MGANDHLDTVVITSMRLIINKSFGSLHNPQSSFACSPYRVTSCFTSLIAIRQHFIIEHTLEQLRINEKFSDRDLAELFSPAQSPAMPSLDFQ